VNLISVQAKDFFANTQLLIFISIICLLRILDLHNKDTAL